MEIKDLSDEVDILLELYTISRRFAACNSLRQCILQLTMVSHCKQSKKSQE